MLPSLLRCDKKLTFFGHANADNILIIKKGKYSDKCEKNYLKSLYRIQINSSARIWQRMLVGFPWLHPMPTVLPEFKDRKLQAHCTIFNRSKLLLWATWFNMFVFFVFSIHRSDLLLLNMVQGARSFLSFYFWQICSSLSASWDI